MHVELQVHDGLVTSDVNHIPWEVVCHSTSSGILPVHPEGRYAQDLKLPVLLGTELQMTINPVLPILIGIGCSREC